MLSLYQDLPKSPPKILKHRDVLVATAEMAVFNNGNNHDHTEVKENSEPQIEYLSDKGIITGVAITCVCGKEIVLKFDYENKR